MAYRSDRRICEQHLDLMDQVVSALQTVGECTIEGRSTYQVHEILKNFELYDEYGYADLRRAVRVSAVKDGVHLQRKPDAVIYGRHQRPAKSLVPHETWQDLVTTKVYGQPLEFEVVCQVPKGDQPNHEDVRSLLEMHGYYIVGFHATPQEGGLTVEVGIMAAKLGHDPYEARKRKRSPFDLLDEHTKAGGDE